MVVFHTKNGILLDKSLRIIYKKGEIRMMDKEKLTQYVLNCNFVNQINNPPRLVLIEKKKEY